MGLLDSLKKPATPPPATDTPVTTRPAPQINPPEAAKTPPAAPKATTPAGFDLSPLTAAIQTAASRLAPRDLRDEMVLAILRSGQVEQWGKVYALADELLKMRDAK